MDKQSQAPKVLAQARTLNEVSTRYQDLLEKNAAEKTAAQAKIREAITALVENERVFDHQREKIATALESHVACLELLRDVACHRNAGEIETMGTTVGQEKSASVRSRVTGAPVADWGATEAGRAFENTLRGGV